ncbi:gelsolin-like isoform X2 [Cydia splendana]
MPEPHAAFTNCGKKEGLETWRIENFQPVPVAPSNHGKFYSGDSYIVLKAPTIRMTRRKIVQDALNSVHKTMASCGRDSRPSVMRKRERRITTSGVPSSLSYDVHFWLGRESSQDEKGAAAILSVNLDEARFNGAAIQHREVQGYESQVFLDYFKPMIRYLDGGHASGFSKVTTNEGSERRLFQIKGKKNVRVIQVEAHISKMNAGDCFILDKGHDVFVYVGAEAKSVERHTAIRAANQIRDQDHNGRGVVQIIDSSSTDEELNNFFAALGSGDKDSVPPASDGGDDEKFETGVAKAVKLFEISDASGQMKTIEIKPIMGKSQLKSDECYILDAYTSGVFVWVGKKSNQKEKMEAMNRAEEYLKNNNCPAWIHVSKVPEGGEPAPFKLFFPEWA